MLVVRVRTKTDVLYTELCCLTVDGKNVILSTYKCYSDVNMGIKICCVKLNKLK